MSGLHSQQTEKNLEKMYIVNLSRKIRPCSSQIYFASEIDLQMMITYIKKTDLNFPSEFSIFLSYSLCCFLLPTPFPKYYGHLIFSGSSGASISKDEAVVHLFILGIYGPICLIFRDILKMIAQKGINPTKVERGFSSTSP